MQPAQRTKQTPLILLSALVLAACGGREVPGEWPQRAAASPAAEAAPPALVTRALDGPPPLPGEAASGWVGLSAPAEAAAHDHSDHEPADAAVRFVCPMHPDVVSDHPGTCPRCGMALVKRDAPK